MGETGRPVKTFQDQQHQAADNEGRGDARRVKEPRLDDVVEEDAQHGGGQECGGDLEPEQEGRARVRLGMEGEEARPEIEDHGEDGGKLDDDHEGLGEARAAFEGKPAFEQDQVARAAYRQEFGEAFDDTQGDYF